MFPTLLQQHLDTFAALPALRADIEAAAERLARALKQGGRILLCGNGGSAADSQHLAAELVGRFVHHRRALPALALTTDTSALTAIGNDYGFEHIFARQVEALGAAGDVLIALSTSGHSPNILAAVAAARAAGLDTIGLLGRDGGPLRTAVDQAIVVPATETARIQEAHIFIGHCWCALIERALEL